MSIAEAANKTWTTAVSGDFGAAANWSGGVPTSVDSATFSAAGTYTVTFDNSPVLANPVLNQDLFFQAGTVTFTSGNDGAYTYHLLGAGSDDAVITGGSVILGTSGHPLHMIVDDDLRIRGGASMFDNFGSDITTADLFLGDSTAPTGDGTLVIDGAGSSLTVSGSAQLGTGGQIGTLTVRNSATANFTGVLGLADASTAHFSNGILNVESGAFLNTGNIRIAPNATNGQTGTFNVGSVAGTSTVTQAFSASLVVGGALGGPTPNSGTLNVNTGGVFNSGDGLGTLTINRTGTINIAGGTLNANGNVTINGGVLTRKSAGTFNLDTHKTMTIQNGGSYNGSDTFYYTVDATYIVTGAGSTWTDSSSLSVGLDGTGSLTIAAAGAVSNAAGFVGNHPGSNGAVTVTGAGSTWTNHNQIEVGIEGTGSLLISAGGVVSNQFGYVAFEQGGSGAVTVTGAGSRWTNNFDLQLGRRGTGSLTISTGGVVSNINGFVGVLDPSNSTATVTGAGSTWTNTGYLSVGYLGTGSLMISAGGAVSNTIGYVGHDAGSVGAVTVTGAGSTWGTGDALYVGGDETTAGGSGTVTILPGGAVSVAKATVLYPAGLLRLEGGMLVTETLENRGGAFAWTSGTLHLTGAGGLMIAPGGPFGSALLLNQNQTLSIDKALAVDAGATMFVGGGLKTGSTAVMAGGQLFVSSAMPDFGTGLINSGDVVFSVPTTVDGPVTNAAGGALTALKAVTFSDLVSGAGGFFGAGTMTFSGGLSPGASPAAVSFQGSVALSETNTLFIKIGGATPGSQYDRLTIAGSASLDGTLDVSLINGLMPTGGQQFTIFTAGGIVNNGFVLAGSAASSFNLLVNGTSVILQAIGLPGDFNGNGNVDTADYVVWRKNQGTTHALLNDPIGGTIGTAQYNQWRTHFGQPQGSGAGAMTSATVPEPSTLVLLMLAAAGWGFRRDRAA